MEGVDFTNADLQNVDFQSAWLVNTNFNGSNLNNIEFGQRASIQLEHEVLCLQCSQNGQILVVASFNMIKIYNYQTLKLITTLQNDRYNVLWLQFNPDDSKLLSCSYDKVINVYNTQNWQLVNTIEIQVTKFEYNQDGKYILGINDTELYLYNPDFEMIKQFTGHSESIEFANFSSNNQWIVSGDTIGVINIWDVNSGKLLKSISGHKDRVNCVRFNMDNTLIASASEDKTVKIWDTSFGSFALKNTLVEHDNQVSYLQFSSNGEYLVSASANGKLILWSAKSQQLIKQIQNVHSRVISNIIFSYDNQTIISTGWDKSIQFTQTSSNPLLKQLPGHLTTCKDATFNHDYSLIATCCFKGLINFWTYEGVFIKQFLNQQQAIRYVKFSPDNQLLFTSNLDNTVRVFEVSSGKCVKELQFQSYVRQLCVHKNSTDFVLVSSSGWQKSIVQGWSLYKSEPTFEINNEDEINEIVYNADCSLIAYTGDKINAYVCDAQMGESKFTLSDSREKLKHICFDNSNGNIICSKTNWAKAVFVWNKYNEMVENNYSGEQLDQLFTPFKVHQNKKLVLNEHLVQIMRGDETEAVLGQFELKLSGCTIEEVVNLGDENRMIIEQKM
ncbi:Conserved_hypothetical protein [Hexamita inflata]|uniref:Uncharacterized protein n=1 Tax=Hexamita inflata TaxID=28002 RepID=A0AA86QJX1_9EUKA|nr:Conserved hypothetical protein [Hexamita inflata]